MTVVWHMDDLLVACRDDFSISKFVCYLASIYEPKLAMKKGRRHNYLGIDLHFKESGELGVSMFEYLEGIFEQFPKRIKRRRRPPRGITFSR